MIPDKINKFIVVAPLCTPVFRNIHNPSLNQYKTTNCWCPYSEQLGLLQRKQYIFSNYQYKYNINRSNDLHTHLNQTKCMFHELSLVYLKVAILISKAKV